MGLTLFLGALLVLIVLGGVIIFRRPVRRPGGGAPRVSSDAVNWAATHNDSGRDASSGFRQP